MKLLQAFGQFAAQAAPIRSATGLITITPSSITNSGGSATLVGPRVDYTNATSVSVNDVFDSTYRAYIINGTALRSTGDGAVQISMRVGGSNDSTSNYYTSNITATHTTNGGGDSGALTIASIFSNSSSFYAGFTIPIWNPGIAADTNMLGLSANGYLDGYLIDRAVLHDVASAFDGFTLTTSGGNNATGSLVVYGLVM